jgi:hypothetical protein
VLHTGALVVKEWLLLGIRQIRLVLTKYKVEKGHFPNPMPSPQEHLNMKPTPEFGQDVSRLKGR